MSGRDDWKTTGERPSDSELRRLSHAVFALLDREGLQPHNQIFVLAHLLATSAVSLAGASADAIAFTEVSRLAFTLLETRFKAVVRVAMGARL